MSDKQDNKQDKHHFRNYVIAFTIFWNFSFTNLILLIIIIYFHYFNEIHENKEVKKTIEQLQENNKIQLIKNYIVNKFNTLSDLFTKLN